MKDFILSTLQDILMVLVTAGVGFFIAYLKKKLGVETMKKLEQQSALVRQLVLAGVQFAEQRYKSGEKLDKAIEWISARLTEKGIAISKDEIEGLIEATVRELKDQFGEDWANAVDKKDQPAEPVVPVGPEAPVEPVTPVVEPVVSEVNESLEP